jgi:hypothetical protein
MLKGASGELPRCLTDSDEIVDTGSTLGRGGRDARSVSVVAESISDWTLKTQENG